MVVSASRNGVLAAWRRPGLAILLWVWSLLLSLPLALPAWTWLQSGTARTPDADVLLDRFTFAVIGDLLRADSSLSLLVPVFLATVFVAIVGQALTGGGLIEVLTSEDARPFLHRFFRGAGHFFWRFLRAGICAWLLFGIAAAIITVAFGPIGRALEGLDWEPAQYLGVAARLLVIALLALFITLGFDYARIRMAREDSRRALRAFFASVWFVAVHPRATLGVWLVMAVATAIVLALHFVLGARLPASGWAGILLALGAQQGVILVRAGLRVALIAGEIDVWTRIVPGAPAAAGVEPSPAGAGADSLLEVR